MLLAALAPGESTIEGALASDDTRYLAEALRALGLRLEVDEAHGRIAVEGRGGKIPAKSAELFVGNAGTAMRFLAGMLMLSQGRFRLDGSPRMRERPMGGLLEALVSLGVDARSERGNGCPPIAIDTQATGPAVGGETEVPATISSQFVSALLMPAPLLPRGLTIRLSGSPVARPFITMTLRMMAQWNALSHQPNPATIAVPGEQSYAPQRYRVEPDATAATYFWAAAALIGGRVEVPGLSRESVQGDVAFAGVLEQMGAQVECGPDFIAVSREGRPLRGVDVALDTMPDTVATLAAIAPFAKSPTRIRGVGFIRHHESDRLRALATELRRLDGDVEEFDDGLLIRPATLQGASVETYDDHRIAMALSLVGLKIEGVRIKNPGCVAKTFPDFFTRLASLAA